MAATGSEECVQVIDENKQFNSLISPYISQSSDEISYHVIAVFGSQSTGKLTLLNTLFHTSFDVMSENLRKQTTKGIWLAKLPSMNTSENDFKKLEDSLFVMDVEGTDGRERGDDQDFERKAALFALSTTEILIINIWEHQIGLYQGANMALLKTVFEVNFALFGRAKAMSGSKHKTLLLVVIRDHVGVTPQQNLTDTVTTDLRAMFDSLSKLSDLAHLTFDDFFDLEFHCLPHKILQPFEFVEGIKKLGDKIPSYFKPEYHHDMPVDGWPMYAEQCWEQIENNKDLDLPTQQILVAQFKCDEVATDARKQFEEDLDLLQAQFVPQSATNYKELGERLGQIHAKALDQYVEGAGKYHPLVFELRQTDLNDAMEILTGSLVASHADFLAGEAAAKLAVEISDLDSQNFVDGVVGLIKGNKNMFQDALTLLSPTIDPLLIKSYDARITKVVEDQKRLALSAAVSTAVKKSKQFARRTISKQIAKPSSGMWRVLVDEFNAMLKGSTTTYGSDFGLGIDEAEATEAWLAVRFRSWAAFADQVQFLLSRRTVTELVREAFEDSFRYDKEGVPKLYQDTKQLEAGFQSATRTADLTLDRLAVARDADGELVSLDVDVFDPALVAQFSTTKDIKNTSKDIDESDEETAKFPHILTETELGQVRNKLRKEWAARFIETKRLIVLQTTRIPIYIYVALAVLGWNEFLAVLRNPLLFTLLALISAGMFALYSLGLLHPAMAIASKASGEAMHRISMQMEKIGDSATVEKEEAVEMEFLDESGHKAEN